MITLQIVACAVRRGRPKGRHYDYPTRAEARKCASQPRQACRAEARKCPSERRRGVKNAQIEAAPATFQVGRRAADYVALAKPRLNLLVVASSAAGYYLGSPAAPELTPMAAGGLRYRAGGWRSGGPEPGVRARHRRADAADAAAPAAGSSRKSRRSARVRHRPLRGGNRPSWRWREPARGARRRGHARHLPRGLHAVEAAVGDLDAGRRRARRTSAAHRMDGRTRRDRRGRLDALRDRLPVADSALHGDRVDLPRRLPPCRLPDAAGDRT